MSGPSSVSFGLLFLVIVDLALKFIIHNLSVCANVLPLLHSHTNYIHFDLLLLFLLFCCSADVYYVYYCISEHQVDVVCVWHMCLCLYLCVCVCLCTRIKITYIQYRFKMIERISFSLSSTIYSVYIFISTKCYRNNYSLCVRTFRFLSFAQNTTKHFRRTRTHTNTHTFSLSIYLVATFFFASLSLSHSQLCVVSMSVSVSVSVLCFFPAYYAALNVWEHTKATRIYLFNPIANYWRTCLLVAMFAQVLFVCWRWNFKCICSFNAIRISASWLCPLLSSLPI